MLTTMTPSARIAFSKNKDPPADSDKKELAVKINAKFGKVKDSLAAENEVSVSVTWTGGGQRLKLRKFSQTTNLNSPTGEQQLTEALKKHTADQDWDFDTIRDVALKFPDLCAKTPMRTHALLTKYTALRTFHATQTFDLPMYDKTGTYTNILQEAYLDYKSILAAIQVLTFDVAEGNKSLIANPRSSKAGKRHPKSCILLVGQCASGKGKGVDEQLLTSSQLNKPKLWPAAARTR